MNARTDMDGFEAAPRAPARTPPHATHKLKLLLKREFWEHKGGFFWAPVWAGGISLVLTLMALVMAEVGLRRTATAHGGIQVDGQVVVNGLDLSLLTDKMSPEDLQKLADGVSMSTATAMIWPLLALGFVVFFYCLGSLYDERKNRSVLFWKSLPVSDRDTVLSKAASALLVAPALAVAVGIACMVAFLLVLSVFVLIHHGNPFTLLWSPGNLLANAGLAIAAIPVYALWALPSAGWLMLCSAWARNKPFLWAIMLPVFAGVFISWFDLLHLFDLQSSWFWKHVVAHLLGGVFPGSWFSVIDLGALKDGHFGHMAALRTMYTTLATPQLWIGAAAGVVMIAASIRLRRWRDDN
ncbi:ABC-2 transporter permease [Thermomonas haemolytica]|uniref:ABC-2 type transport system permease protein n=1 Tax=Thermomonas haemolytica TaxID=141949 RepID=A0A4R3N7U0_9GAMM|nr:ABC-2 transporter permease [Thermomonas haemolytica]TCT24521.1 ABC-2 type transport system permease protein [Thermomonas haemolytica]